MGSKKPVLSPRISPGPICRQMNETIKKNILSEVNQTQKDKQYVLTHKWILDIKQKITSLQSTTSEKLGSKEDPEGDIHGSSPPLAGGN